MAEEKTRARKKRKRKNILPFPIYKTKVQKKKDCIDGRINRIEKREKKSISSRAKYYKAK